MIKAYYEFCHHTLGVHMYTIPLIIAAVLAVVIGLLHWRKQSKGKKNSGMRWIENTEIQKRQVDPEQPPEDREVRYELSDCTYDSQI